MSDHGFGPIEWYVNFNVWLLERGDIALQDSFYVKQKHWFYRRGVTPEWFYGADGPARPGRASGSSRFRGKQTSRLERLARVGVPVAAAHRLVADAGLCAGQLRPDLPEPQGAAAAGVRRARGRPRRCSTT